MINDSFDCSSNKLTLLNGPREVSGDFLCYGNVLKSLVGGPEFVGGYYKCSSNQITNFDGLPEYFDGRLDISKNIVGEVYDLFDNNQEAIYWIRYYDVISGMNVSKHRAIEVFNVPEVKRQSISKISSAYEIFYQSDKEPKFPILKHYKYIE